LESLDISNNQLSGIIPYYLSDSLTALFLDNNSFIGSIPVSFATHPSLHTLSASKNELTDLPSEWTSLIYRKGDAPFPLRYVDVSGNDIGGPFPQGLAFYPLLETLDLSNNRLTGQMGPQGYDDAFQSLKSLKLTGNTLEGPLPEWTRYVPGIQVSNNLSRLEQSNSSGLSGGAIAGIVLGTLVGVTILIIVAVVVWRQYRKDSFERYVSNHTSQSVPCQANATMCTFHLYRYKDNPIVPSNVM
jgi:Leucine-rich repeat (LRR) protein